MTTLLFESPVQLTLVVVPLLLVLCGVWSRTRSASSRQAVWIGLLVAASLFVVQALVVTNSEELETTTRQLAALVEAGDIAEIISLIDPQADFGTGYTRDDFENKLDQLLSRYTVRDSSLSAFEMEVRERQATVRCRSWCMVKTTQWSTRVPASWELTFKLSGDEWRITNIRPLEIARQKMTSFWDMH